MQKKKKRKKKKKSGLQSSTQNMIWSICTNPQHKSLKNLRFESAQEGKSPTSIKTMSHTDGMALNHAT
jgi:hypothetical protein